MCLAFGEHCGALLKPSPKPCCGTASDIAFEASVTAAYKIAPKRGMRQVVHWVLSGWCSTHPPEVPALRMLGTELRPQPMNSSCFAPQHVTHCMESIALYMQGHINNTSGTSITRDPAGPECITQRLKYTAQPCRRVHLSCFTPRRLQAVPSFAAWAFSPPLPRRPPLPASLPMGRIPKFV
jgi:hypothetical protein